LEDGYPDTDAQYPPEDESRGAPLGKKTKAAISAIPVSAAPPPPPPPRPLPAIDDDELDRIRAALGLPFAGPGATAPIANTVPADGEDDEVEFDPDEYPEYEVEEIA
jgi:hypothetical protein